MYYALADKINPGQVISNIASTMDIFPTITQIIGKGKINNKIDGISLLPLLEGIQTLIQEMNSIIIMVKT